MNILYVLLLVPLCLLGRSLQAEALPLTALIDIALKNNPETQMAWANVHRAQAATGMAKASLYPQVDVQANVAHGREVKYPNGPETVFTNYGADLCLNYLLFDFGERQATVQATREALKAARWSTDFTLQKIVSKVAAHYYEYINAHQILETKKQALADALVILDSAEHLHRAGLRSMTDLTTSKATVAQNQMEIARARAQEKIAYGKLLMTLGVAQDSSLEIEMIPEQIFHPQVSEGVPALIALAEEQRADLLARQAHLGEMESRYTRAKRAFLPKLRFNGLGGWDEYAKHQDSGYNYTVGLALDIPLFRGFESTYLKQQASAEVDLSLAEIKELQNAIALEVLSFSASVTGSSEALMWSGQFLDEAQKSYDGSLENYKAGLQNIFDLIQAQRNLADARLRQTQARTEWLVSIAELAFATGSILK